MENSGCAGYGVMVEVREPIAAVDEVLEVGLAMVALLLGIVVTAGVVRVNNLFLALRKI